MEDKEQDEEYAERAEWDKMRDYQKSVLEVI